VCPSADSGVGLPPEQASRSSMPFFTTKPKAGMDFASAAPSSNRMVALLGLPTTPRAAQFLFPYSTNSRHMNDAAGAPTCS